MKKNLLFLSLMLLGGASMYAQEPTHEKYVQREPQGTSWADAYRNWTPGQSLYTTAGYDDEEFYISRVKPRKRFTNAATQVNPSLDSDRKMLWWCPIGTEGWNAIPTYFFDSEVYTMWSYTDIYGNWTAPFVRMPGAFADVCHKNGVTQSVLASVAWASTVSSTDGSHGSNMAAMIDGGADKFIKYLRYYGIDGIGYNSEFNIGSGISLDGFKNFLGDCFTKAPDYDWHFNNCWYSLMSSSGYVGGTDCLSSSNQDWFNYNGKPTSNAYFMNYNWGASYLSTSQSTAESFDGRSSYDVYAGMDYQGRSVADWLALQNYKISVGIWGAHNMNMMFEGRGELGSSAMQHQKTYQLISENCFSGSNYNPVITPAVSNILRHSTTATAFHGFASFISARSAMTTDDLAKEPMVTYFNLGNGQFFNVNGEKQFPGEWYNIGIQDYVPTWRWWWTTSFMGRTAADVPATGMKAEFTWDDAWYGGSCLEISGATAEEYLQLFKTKYALQAGDKLLIRYKVVSGTAEGLKWACSAEGDETTELAANIASDLEQDENDAWIEKTVNIGTGRTDLKLADKTMALMGLHFVNTSSDFKVRIGEIALTRTTAPTPSAPTITGVKMLASNYKGADLKVFFKMKDSTDPEVPVYNSDVDTWMYKVYTQQEGAEPVMATATTSWAAYVVGAPTTTENGNRMRVGVSALSVDGRSESPITWSEYQDIPDNTIVEGIEIDKSVIKANEEFTVKFIDPNHAAATWEILNAQTGASAATAVANQTSITTSLPTEGIYDLKLTVDGVAKTYQGLIQVSPEAVGALPQILTLTANGSESNVDTDTETPVEFAYTGRKADGKVSRGLRLEEKAFGIPCEQLNFNDQTPFTISFWFNPIKFNHGQGGTQLLNIRTAQDAWPASDWGYIWSQITPAGVYSISFRRTSNSGTQIDVKDFNFEPNQWYHMALVVDYQSGRVMTLYVNGKKIQTSPTITDLYAWKQSNVIMIGGKAFNRAGLDGFIDEFKLYNSALSEADVLKSMGHFNADEIPSSLIGYWDFETDADANGNIMSTGTNKELIAYTVDGTTISEGVNIYKPTTSLFGTGAPFIAGENYVVTTTPSWTFGKGTTTTNAVGNDTEGQATVGYSKAGVYEATLTLTNGWGSDSKTLQYITVVGSSAIDETKLADAFNAAPNPFYDNVNVRFDADGAYDVTIYNQAGVLVSSKKAVVSAGDMITLSVNGAAGAYFVTVRKDGKALKAIKLIKK